VSESKCQGVHLSSLEVTSWVVKVDYPDFENQSHLEGIRPVDDTLSVVLFLLGAPLVTAFFEGGDNIVVSENAI